MKSYIPFSIMALMLTVMPADALQYKSGRAAFRLTGYGTAGILEPDFDAPEFVGDWRVRGQFNYAVAAGQSLGAVYSIDQIAIDEDKFMREAFAFFESRDYGRIEVGFTDSIARKLGVGLPDVGGLRVNDKPLFYKKITPDGAVIADTAISTGRSALRANIVTVPNAPAQVGLSVAGAADDYDYAVDAGLKIRRPTGKLKTALSLGASFMQNPDGYETETYNPHVTADWRAQASAGLNLQYNSWIWAATARVIYDRNPVGPVSDGLVVGTGVSYDILNYSISLTYMFSDTGIWDRDVKNYDDHSVIGSFRYKYSENVDGWMSLGLTTETPFLAVGMRLTF